MSELDSSLSLPDDLQSCHQLIRAIQDMNAELLAQLRNVEGEKQAIAHRLDQLLRQLYGPRAEKIDPNQLLLFADLLAKAEPGSLTPAAGPQPKSSTPRQRRSRDFPEHLPRRRVEYDLAEAEKACSCGKTKARIGEEITEQLDYEPASIHVIEHVRFRYACQHCQNGVIRTPKPPQPIEGGTAGPGLMAHVAVSKYLDHLPLNRQERMFSRQGITLSRKTMADWMAQAAQLIEPIYKRMRARILGSRVLHTDDTTVPVQQPGNGKTRTSRLWVYIGDRDHPFTVFDYTPTRSRDGPAEFLHGYQGYLQADAYSGYDHLYAGGKIVEVACWAHARRKFYDARSSDPERAYQMLGFIGSLYAVEKEATDTQLSNSERGQLRTARSKPQLETILGWLLEQRRAVLPKSPIGQAIAYALGNWDALVRYSGDGILAIDNNPAERALRSIVIGRKNWLFAGSDQGARTAAILCSVLSSSQRLGSNPFHYLRHLLNAVSYHSASRIDELLPGAPFGP